MGEHLPSTCKVLGSIPQENKIFNLKKNIQALCGKPVIPAERKVGRLSSRPACLKTNPFPHEYIFPIGRKVCSYSICKQIGFTGSTNGEQTPNMTIKYICTHWSQKGYLSGVWLHMPWIPAPGRQRRVDLYVFKARKNIIEGPCLKGKKKKPKPGGGHAHLQPLQLEGRERRISASLTPACSRVSSRTANATQRNPVLGKKKKLSK